jgi:5,10-methylenetetrahydromethanopterin reductase
VVDIATGVWLFPDAPAPDLVQAAEQAERLGIAEFWLGDEGPAREPFAVLAAAAVRTRSIRLAVGITNPYARHPALSAVSTMTVDELSGGRAILGLGVGGSISLGPLGIEPRRPLASVRGALRIMRATCRGEKTDGYTPPSRLITAPNLPIYIGSRSERINCLASAEADGSFVAGLPLVRLAQVIGWNRSVHPIKIALYVGVAFGPDELERIRPQMVYAFLNAPPETAAMAGLSRDDLQAAADAFGAGDKEPARRLLTDEVLSLTMLSGTPQEVGRRLAQLYREYQPASIGLALHPEDIPTTIDACGEAFAAFAREVA